MMNRFADLSPLKFRNFTSVAAALTGLLLLSTACTPKIYVIDRQTVLEQEAAGQWPQYEKELIQKSKAKGPEALSKVPVNAQRTRLYNVLNGEMTSTPVAASGAAK